MRAEAGLADEGRIFRALAHIEASEEILVFGGDGISAGVVLQILQVSLDHRTQVAHLGHKQMFTLHDAFDNVAQRDGCWLRGRSCLNWSLRHRRGSCRCRHGGSRRILGWRGIGGRG